VLHSAYFAASLQAKHAGIGLSVFQSISTVVGGFAGPYLFGSVLSQQQAFGTATLLMGCFLAGSGVLAMGLGAAEQWQRRNSTTTLRAAAGPSPAGGATAARIVLLSE
jgi:hypothetical protein